MVTTRLGWVAGVFVMLVAVVSAEESSVVGKKDEKALRERALALNDVTGADPMRGVVQDLLDDLPGTKKLVQVALRMSKDKPQPFNRTATYLLAVVAESAREVDAAVAFYRLNADQSLKLFSERGLAQAYLGLIGVYSDNGRFPESEKVCKEFLAIESEEDDAVERLKPLVLRRMILSIAKQGSGARALKMIDEQIEANPTNFLHRALKAQVLRELDQIEEAVKTYLDVIERIKKDDRLAKDEKIEYADEYRYLLSNLYVDLNQIDKAAEQLKTLIEHEPTNPTYLNDLGYIWADRSMNLAESEKLIRKAIEEDRKIRKKYSADLKPEEDRDSAAYLDSLGWVLFKQGKAKEALPHLLSAVKEKDGQHLEILDHLADIHMALGQKAEAIAAWKKGLESATQTKRDQKRKVAVQKKLDTAMGK